MRVRRGLTDREKRIAEIAAQVMRAAAEDLPNNPTLCAAIVRTAQLHLKAAENEMARLTLAARRAEYDALPWWKRLFAEAP